jgi:hypothetical protein
VIDAPGTNGGQAMLIEACAIATVVVFTAWRHWRPDDVAAERVYPIITVHFVDDELMDDLEKTIFHGEKRSAYLSDASSAVQHVPLVVMRKSCARDLIATGQPLIHEVIHALMNYFQPEAQGDMGHANAAWSIVQDAAVASFKVRFAPETVLKKRR